MKKNSPEDNDVFASKTSVNNVGETFDYSADKTCVSPLGNVSSANAAAEKPSDQPGLSHQPGLAAGEATETKAKATVSADEAMASAAKTAAGADEVKAGADEAAVSAGETTSPAAGKAGTLGAMLRYVLVGGSAFVLDFGLLGLLVSGLKMPAGISAAIAFIIGAIYSYLMQKYFTFQAQKQVLSSVVKYLILLGINTLFTALVVEALDYFGLYLVGKVIATIITTIWNFPLMQHWVYKAQQP